MDRISALMDGELDGRQAREELARLKQQDELRDSWDTYHLISDALRGDALLSANLGHRVSERLAREPTVLAPHRSAVRKLTTYALSAAASISAVALVGWVAISVSTVNIQPETARAPTLAAVLPPLPPAPQLANVPSEGGMNEYLLAHQGFSPSTAIQGVAPYIRSVSVSQPATDR
jgi:sigma-E factor negative regulatory protein RseA